MSLLEKIFSQIEIESIQKLMDDDSLLLIEREIGSRLMKSEDILHEEVWNQVYSIVSMAPFTESRDERLAITDIIKWGAFQVDIFPSIAAHRKQDLAYRCLISLSFYKQNLERKYQKFGAPSPDYYREIGIGTFQTIGMENIGEHFGQWEHFLGEVFQ